MLVLVASAAHAQVYRCGSTWSQTPCTPDQKPPPLLAPSEDDRKACRAHLLASLADPDSAKVAEWQSTLRDGRAIVYGGTVNARNRMGGYAGATEWTCHVQDGRVLRVWVNRPRL